MHLQKINSNLSKLIFEIYSKQREFQVIYPKFYCGSQKANIHYKAGYSRSASNRVTGVKTAVLYCTVLHFFHFADINVQFCQNGFRRGKRPKVSESLNM